MKLILFAFFSFRSDVLEVVRFSGIQIRVA